MKLILLVTDVGGPVALHSLLSEMPEHFGHPIVVLPSSELGLLESSAAALRRTISLPIEMIQPVTALRAGCVFFGAPNSCYRPTFHDGRVSIEAVGVNREEEYVRKTLENFAGTYGDELTVVFLSGRGRNEEIQSCCSTLERSGCRLIVFHRSETVVFDMGQCVLEECPSAVELTSSEIVTLVTTSSRTLPARSKKPSNTTGK